MSKISKNFRIEEFIKPAEMELCKRTCPDYKTRIRKKIINPMLQPLRTAISLPIIITSGFRSAEHNFQTGGNPHSHHLFHADRCAADFTTGDMPAAWQWLEAHRERFCYAYWDKERNFIHLSALTATDDRIGKMWVLNEKE